MTFAVTPSHLRSAAADMRVLGSTISMARAQAETTMSVPDGGVVYDGIGAEIEKVRGHMLAAYADGGQVPDLFHGAADTLAALSHDYTTVDADQAARYDGMLPESSRPDMKQYEWEPDRPGVDQGALLETVGASPADTFGEYEQWRAINDVSSSVVKFEWLTDPLDKVGIDFDLVEKFEYYFDGDWGELGLAIGAMAQVQDYWSDVAHQLQGVVGHFEGSWTGDAADSCISWFTVLQDACFDHAKALSKTGQRIKAEALAFLEGLRAMQDALDDIADNIPDFSSVGGFLGSVAGSAIDAATGKLLKLVQLAWDAFQLALAGAQAVVAGFAQLTRFFSTEWPSTPTLATPDVDGPAA